MAHIVNRMKQMKPLHIRQFSTNFRNNTHTTSTANTVRITYVLAFIASIICCQALFAQKNKLKKARQVMLVDSLTSFSQSDIFRFPNVNRINFFHDVNQLKIIQGLEKENSAALYEALKKYVSSFGIGNFSRNVPMIWRLAELSEKFGPKGEAILLYKLALKHHQQGVNIKDLLKKYERVETDKKEYYVPLDTYYNLVSYRKEIDTLRPPHSVLEPMGDLINSKKEDYGPAIGNVDYVLLYTSKRNEHEERAYDEDIFYSLKVDGVWTEGQPFKEINTKHNEGSACLSLDGKYFFFSRCDASDGLCSCDLYVSKLGKDSVWAAPKNLGPTVNSNGWESQPSLSHSGDTLFFASNRVGGFGLSDIYFSVKDRHGKWGKAQNVGPIINTVQSEVSPFFHHKFNVLYFSSNGQPLNFSDYLKGNTEVKDFDIYKSYRLSNGWSEPKNIGPLVNGPGSEYYFTIDSKSHDLYYARSTADDVKNLDLYSFPVPMEAQPEAIAQLHGTIKDKQGKPVKGIVSVIDLEYGV